MFALYLIVFIGMVGFGVVFPLIPFFSRHAGADPEMVGLIIAAYAVGQLVGTPVFGRLSDTYGRRPILIVTSALTIFPYLVLAVADTVPLLMLSRFVAGVTAGNISVAYAYVADVADPKDRAKLMGRVSAAFGAGFFAGPAIGGLFAGDTVENANFELLSFLSAGFSGLAALAALLVLEESLPRGLRKPFSLTFDGALALGEAMAFLGRRQLVAMMVVCFLLAQTGALVQAIMPEWLHGTLGLEPRAIGFAMGYVALVGFFMQGGVVGPVVDRLGEERAARASVLMYGASFFLLIYSDDVVKLLLSMTVVAVGFGILTPSLQSLLTRLAAPHEYGTVIGVQQSVMSFARVTGPIVAWSVHGAFGGASAFVSGALSVLPGVVLLFWVTRAGTATAPELKS